MPGVLRVLLRILLSIFFHRATKIDYFLNLLKNTHPLFLRSDHGIC